MNRWLLHDPAGALDDYTFAVNPNVMASPYVVRTLDVRTTSDGVYRGFGHERPHEWTFSGVLLDEDQYTALAAWCDYGVRVQLTDHLSRLWDVRLTRFTPTRAGTRQHPWRHKYTVALTTYGGPA